MTDKPPSSAHWTILAAQRGMSVFVHQPIHIARRLPLGSDEINPSSVSNSLSRQAPSNRDGLLYRHSHHVLARNPGRAG